jgi:hypothetical protein
VGPGLALHWNGRVDAWGYNYFGALGNGTTSRSGGCYCSDVPVAVRQLSGVRSISAGHDFSLALLTNGTVKAWGWDGNGQLGIGPVDPSAPFRTVPVRVSGLSNVTAVAAGDEHGLALLGNGQVVAWGDGTYGELGTGSTGSSDVPVPVVGLIGVKAISAGTESSFALLKNGTIMVWGAEPGGQVDVPTPVPNVSGVRAISGGGLDGLALLGNGTVVSLGVAQNGPVAGLTGVKAVSTSGGHSLALLQMARLRPGARTVTASLEMAHRETPTPLRHQSWG